MGLTFSESTVNLERGCRHPEIHTAFCMFLMNKSQINLTQTKSYKRSVYPNSIWWVGFLAASKGLFPLVGILRILKMYFQTLFPPQQNRGFHSQRDQSRGKKETKDNSCFKCKKKGHFAAHWPLNKDKNRVLSDTEPQGEASSARGARAFWSTSPSAIAGLLSLREDDISTNLKKSLLATAKQHQMPGKYAGYPGVATGLIFPSEGELDGLLLDGPVSVTHYDWMHCYVVSGVWNTEAGYFLETIKTIAPVKSDYVRLVLMGRRFNQPSGDPNDATTPEDWLNTGLMLCRVASPWSGDPKVSDWKGWDRWIGCGCCCCP